MTSHDRPKVASGTRSWNILRGESPKEAIVGSLIAIALVALLGAVMFPLRSHMSVATSALVLVVPVVIGVATGGFVAGIVAIGIGFLAYDLVFVPPYYTLTAGAPQDWTALGVDVVVMLVTGRVVHQVGAARAEAQRRAMEVRRLFDVSELVVRDSTMPQLFDTIVNSVLRAFDVKGAALLVPVDGRLEIVASAGDPLTARERFQLSADAGVPVSLETGMVQHSEIRAVALAISGRGIGLLALRDPLAASRDHDLLQAFANHLALALERAQLREQGLRAQLLEEIDRLRRSLLGAVSHDLRTPLATIKVSTSTLLNRSANLSQTDRDELLGLVDVQADRLNRLVANLLDMTRIDSGALDLRRQPVSLPELVDEARGVLGSSANSGRVKWQGPPDLPLADVDRVLICQVLANLIDNATRYSPEEASVELTARPTKDGWIEVEVSDRGPGVAAEERTSIFQMFNKRQAGGRGGLGLAIAKAFVEVHGGQIWVESGDSAEGARFLFSLPVAASTSDEQVAAVASAGAGARRPGAQGLDKPAEYIRSLSHLPDRHPRLGRPDPVVK